MGTFQKLGDIIWNDPAGKCSFCLIPKVATIFAIDSANADIGL